jgi:dynein heavy chain 2
MSCRDKCVRVVCRGVITDVLDFDARSITPDVRKQVMRILKDKADSFAPDKIARVSLAAAPLAAWVKANVRYSIVGCGHGTHSTP